MRKKFGIYVKSRGAALIRGAATNTGFMVNRVGLTAVTMSRAVIVVVSPHMTVMFIVGSKQSWTDSSDSV